MTAAHLRRTLSALSAIGAAVSALALGAAPASAGLGGCPGAVEYPFLQWGDTNGYTLAPRGDFEGKSNWTRSGGAKTVSGNETFSVHGSTDAKSLSIPAGGSVTSPSMCVSVYTPTVRLFAKGGSSTSPLKVEVITTTSYGTIGAFEVARIPAGAAWAPTPEIYFFSNFLAAVTPDGSTTVQFRFTPIGGAGWVIDDVYVDPRKST